MPGRNRSCCSAVPYAISVGASRFSPMWLTRAGACARAYSSAQMICWSSDAPRPPASTGHPSPMKPALPSSCSHATRTSKPTSSSPGPPRPFSSAYSPTTWSASHVATSRRKRSSSSVSSTSAMRSGRHLGGEGHELDAHAVGVGQEQEVDAGAGARLLDHGGAAGDEVLRGGLEVVDVERQVGEAHLVAHRRRRAAHPGLGEVEQLDLHGVVLDELRRDLHRSGHLEAALETGRDVAVELEALDLVEAEPVAEEAQRPLEIAHAEPHVRRPVVPHVRVPPAPCACARRT